MMRHAKRFRDDFRDSKYVQSVIIAGAGLSAASGQHLVRCLRGHGFDAISRHYLWDPDFPRRWRNKLYHYRRTKMSIQRYLRKVAPAAKIISHLATQRNVDRLSDRTDPLILALRAADVSLDSRHDAGTKDLLYVVDQKPYHLHEINSANMCLVADTSSTVYPALTYAYSVKRHAGNVFNLELSEEDEQAGFVFHGGCESVLSILFPELAS
ncbi:hypothetical protein C8Q80DRAFT_1221579 [Daedaleopsis nitida]|nr:hypothetical protein C8Q80DRAFT_1221579 [Daedaleopsis nitida]